MGELWDKFLFGFCKVGFLCWNGDPNWLGWILIGVAALFTIGLILAILSLVFE